MRHTVIQKLRAPVRISQAGETPIDGCLCLMPAVAGEGRPETVLELLNCTRRVIPFLHPIDESVALVTRLNIEWVMAGAQLDPAWLMPRRFPATREQRVHLTFVDGRVLEGEVRWASIGGDIRLSDFLSDAADFYPLVTRVGIMMINKNQVRETRVA